MSVKELTQHVILFTCNSRVGTYRSPARALSIIIIIIIVAGLVWAADQGPASTVASCRIIIHGRPWTKVEAFTARTSSSS